jgi:autotransporter-associated beta strand protein
MASHPVSSCHRLLMMPVACAGAIPEGPAVTDATWKTHPISGNYTNPHNWSTGQVPGGPFSTDVATFGASTITKLTSDDVPLQIGGWTFKSGAPAYTITAPVVFWSAGIVNGAKVTIVANASGDRIQFRNDSSAGSAKLVADAGATILFYDHSSADHARLTAKAGGLVDFSVGTGPGGLGKNTAGSIAGAGDYNLGGNDLITGSNNRSATVSGAISDGGTGSGSGALLEKVGTGTLKLSHAGNTYSGGTLLEHGRLDLAALGAVGTGAVDFVGLATLKIENSALSSHAFGNTVADFGVGDKIDLSGLKFVTHAKATLNGTTLTVKSGHVTDTLTLVFPETGTFKAKDDGHGGTKVVLVPPPAKPVANAATADKHHSDAHHAGHTADSLAADSFEFAYLAGFTGLDRASTPDFHFWHDQHEISLDAGSHEPFGWTDPSHANPGHDAHMLSGHDFFL